ncbi:hypothetical protein [Haloechinothrix sp. LS1_15]|uniref:hypothetical protein n=1 Tax=Haloechinothrix sp. LS1_15 TaxID=2652248 RepID=UPI002947020D|nr:hypothetical protein [Haloechinothrix sp. LS1_15]MDV6011097.1 hypothetical protein [Haloechinothrix sp. LS1_15]
MLPTLALSVAVTLNVVAIGAMFHIGITPSYGSVRARRRARARQVESLRAVHQHARGDVLELDRAAYREVPRCELIELLARNGWHYTGEHLDTDSWLIRFNRVEQGGPVPVVDARTRLRQELATARPDVNGMYRLDLNNYLNLPHDEVRAHVGAAGWRVCATVPDSPSDGLLIAPAWSGPVGQQHGHGPVAASGGRSGDPIGDVDVEAMRSDRTVAHRAVELRRELGFDPLDARNLELLRARHRAVQKRIVVPANVAGLLFLVVATGPLAWLFYGHFADNLPIVFAISGVAAVPCLILLAWCLVLVKRRNDELGPAIRAYRELRQLAEDRRRLTQWFRD